MTLAELVAEIKDCVEAARFFGVNVYDVKVTVRDSQGAEFNVSGVYSVIKTLQGVIINIEE